MLEHKKVWSVQRTVHLAICPAHLSAQHHVKGFAPPSCIERHVTKSGPIIVPHPSLATGIGSEGGSMTLSGPIIVLHLSLLIGIGLEGGHMTQPSQNFSNWRGGVQAGAWGRDEGLEKPLPLTLSLPRSPQARVPRLTQGM